MLALEWDDAAKDALARVLSRAEPLILGAASAFVPIDSGRGVKLFPSSESRDFALGKQQIASSHGLAPSTGDAFELGEGFLRFEGLEWKSPWGRGKLRYGYVTERADTGTPPTKREMDELIGRLRAVDELAAPAEFEENPANYGRVRGNLVFLDFDMGTWSDS